MAVDRGRDKVALARKPGALTVDSIDLLMKRAAVKGWCSGIADDSKDTLAISLQNGVASMNETFPLEEAQGRL